MSKPESTSSRYARQVLLPELGQDGQRRLGQASVLVVGCGGLGCALSELLARAGVGQLRVVDRDLVELDNLHRQLLFDEQDVVDCLPKAEAAARRLRRINSDVQIEARVADLAPHNVMALVEGSDLVLDGTDNVETRYLINDACLEAGVPWIYGGAVATTGMTMTILPGRGPCLRCVFPEPVPPGSLPTCDTAGVLNVLPALVATLQATEALKLLVGSDDLIRELVVVDPWQGSHRRVSVARASDCPACAFGQRDFLDGVEVSRLTRMCGRNAVQVDPPQDMQRALDELEEPLGRVGKVAYNGHVLRFWLGDLEMVLFADGRAIIHGTTDPIAAKSFYAKYVGM